MGGARVLLGEVQGIEGLKVSVIIPCVKRDELFDRCVRSIERSVAAARGCDVEHELVVVEGVSPVGAARNEGLRRATGDWIAWADADDEVEEAWFPEICRALVRANAPGSEIDDIVFDMTSVTPTRETVCAYGRDGLVDGPTMRDDLLRDIRLGSYSWLHVTSRRLWADERFEEIAAMEDYVTLPRVLGRARRILPVPRPLYRYIARPGSLTTGDRQEEIVRTIYRRGEEYGGCAVIGTSLGAYNFLYNREDRDGSARRWIRRHLVCALLDRELTPKWKLKLVLAAAGVIIRRPK